MVRKRRLLLAASFFIASCGGGGGAARVLSGELPAFRPGDAFAAVGDLQRTSRLEIWREQNDPERERIVARIAADRPAFLVSLGDLVFDGASEKHWARLDRLLAPVREAGVPVLAILGNHEYWGRNEKALANFDVRFPHLGGRRWQAVRWGPLALVLLDGNRGEMGEDAWTGQAAWLRETLPRLDREARGILVFVHQPPWTNSTVTGDEPDIEEAVVPPFLASERTLALVSGHVHSYERFERQGRTLLVAGGGGGPRARLATGADRRHPGDLFAGPALRDFHLLTFRPVDAGVEVVVTGLPKGGADFHEMDRFLLRFR